MTMPPPPAPDATLGLSVLTSIVTADAHPDDESAAAVSAAMQAAWQARYGCRWPMTRHMPETRRTTRCRTCGVEIKER